jgi:23S rRNA pseudouridine1911/1915/1917 synthase
MIGDRFAAAWRRPPLENRCTPPISRPVDAGVQVKHAAMPAEMAGWRLDRALAAVIPTLSRERLKALISAGNVTVGDRIVRDPATKILGALDVSVAVPNPAPAHNEAQDIPLVIAYEDEHLIVVDKPAGLVVHPACGNLDGTLVNALLHHCQGSLSGIGGVERPGIVHRIDKDTSGLMVAAKTDRAHAGLAAQFAKHSIDRRYRAIVAGRPRPAEGRIEGNLGRSPSNRKKMAIVGPSQGKHAVTHYSTLAPLDGAALVECRLETGRTHQVRVHMASIGNALLGDQVYGGRGSRTHKELLERLGFRRQALHAARLGFVHPVTSQALSFESNMPADMQELFSHLLV